MKISKKTIITTLIAALASSMLSLNVSAAITNVYLPLGVVNDFNTSLGNVEDEYGKCVQIISGDSGQTYMYFGDSASNNTSNEITSGEFIFSFDLKMPEDANILRFYGWNPQSMVDKYGVSMQNQFMELKGGGFTTGAGAMSGSYVIDKWQHYDFLMSAAEDEFTLKWYIDGDLIGTLDLTKHSLYGLRTILLYASGGNEQYPRIDNVCLREKSEEIDGTLVYERGNKFNITYSEVITDITESDIKLTREPIGGGIPEEVGFTIEASTATSATIVPDEFIADGYKYVVTINKITVFGSRVRSMNYTLSTSTPVYKFWDFEDGISDNANRPVVQEDYRGYVEQWTAGTGNKRLTLDENLTSGRYLVSYDVKSSETPGIDELLTIDTMSSTTATNYGFFQALRDDNKLYKKNKESSSLLSDKVFEANTWYRVDNVLDLDAKTAEVYIDGEYVGLADLWASKDNVNPISSFRGLRFMWKIPGSLDNVGIKTFSGDFSAKAGGNGNLVYVDFDETVKDLTASNFKVKVASDLLSQPADVDFDIVYASGTRVVLQLEETLRSGAYCVVEFKNIKSIFAKNLLKNEVTFCAVGAGQSVIDEIVFETADGVQNDLRDIASSTKNIAISLPNGLQGDAVNGTISITDRNGDPVTFTPDYNVASKILTLQLDKLLGANQNYSIALTGVMDATGTEYQGIAGTISTGAPVIKLDDMSLTKTATGATATVDCINTKEESVSYYMIFVGYNGNAMTKTDVRKITVTKDDADINKQVIFDDAAVNTYERISTFIWKGYSDIIPLTDSADI